jgi:hypothetical protein
MIETNLLPLDQEGQFQYVGVTAPLFILKSVHPDPLCRRYL